MYRCIEETYEPLENIIYRQEVQYQIQYWALGTQYTVHTTHTQAIILHHHLQ